jgi:hypothetical protein
MLEFRVFSRSESTNNVLNDIVDKTINLTKFVIEYDDIVADMSFLEFNEDFRCKQGVPQRAVKKNGILGHVAQVYTYKMFKIFEKKKKKILNSLAMAWEQVAYQNILDVFEVKEETSERVHNVQIKSSQ